MAEYATPEHWTKGELLNTVRYEPTRYRFVPMGQEASAPHIEFDDQESAQNFLGWWYGRG